MILSRARLVAQQRFDLTDWLSEQSASRTDNKLWTKQFLSSSNYIIKGFAVTGIGALLATIEMDNATLIHGANSSDFSWFVAESSPTDITVTASQLTSGTKNYIELVLGTETNTPVERTLWDSAANNGLGAEFNQTIDTMTDLIISTDVELGGFSGSADRIPLAMVEVDSDGFITGILDRRNLFFRLGTNTDPDADFSWASVEEPEVSLVLTGGSGTFVAGETITFSGGATSTCSLGGTTSAKIRYLSSYSLAAGNAVTGGTSGASRTLVSYIEAFIGADKSVSNFKNDLDAIKTEIKALKNTRFWYQVAPVTLPGLFSALNSQMVALTSGARWTWNGTQLSLTDDDGTPADADQVAKIVQFGKAGLLALTREDSNFTPISIADGQVLFVVLPTSGARTYAGSGSSSTSYQVVATDSFVQADENYWLAFRQGSKLYVRGYGELESGEEAQIGDPISGDILSFIGAVDETDSDPNYSGVTSGSLNLPDYNSSGGESLTSRLAKVTAMLSDIRQDLNITFDPGVVVWDGSNLTMTGGSLSIPGTTVGADQVDINNIGSTALADNSCIYLDISRTVGTALTVAASTTIALLTPSQQRLILFRRIGSTLLVRD